MIVLHGALLEGTFLLWGETPDTGHRRRPRTGTAVSPPRSLLSASREVLLNSLGDCGCSSGNSHFQDVIAWLPSGGGFPLPSHPLIGAAPGGDTKLTLQPWLVGALHCTTTAASELLYACGDDELLAPGIIAGHDLRFLARVARFVAILVARQRFLPGIMVTSADIMARWELVLTGKDATSADELARAMPPACRALSRDALVPPAVPARAALATWMDILLDYVVRGSCTNKKLPVKHVAENESASIHDRWLQALCAPDGTMKGSHHELAAFAAQVREWSHRLAVHHEASSFRLCFRLEEPEASRDDTPATDEPTWRVRYLAQASADPSVLVPLTELWKTGKRISRDVADVLPVSRAALLAALGEAAQLSKDIEASLKQPAPEGFTCDSNAALAFLTETAWLLEDAGFILILPSWWTRRGPKARLTAQARVKSPTLSGHGIGLEALVSVDWDVALGDEPVTLEELAALARLKAPLVKVRGQWVQVQAGDLQAAVTFLQKGPRQAKLRDVLRLAVGAQDYQGLRVERISADGWISDLLARIEGSAELVDERPPRNLHATLRPYQKRGYAWLAFLTRLGLGACLADDMGLGKTLQTLTLIQRDWEEHGIQPVLLICPTSVIENWRKEARRFTPELPVMLHHGGARRRGDEFAQAASRHAIVLSSYALLHRDLDLLRQVSWRGVVLDEAQNIKNAGTKQSKAARALPGNYRIALTGTPVENHVGDLWSLMAFLNPGFLGTESAFRREFFVPIQGARDAVALARLKQLTGPFLLRRLKTDPEIIADLPEKLEMPIYCSLTKEQASLYAAALKDLDDTIDEVEGIQRKGMILATLTKLKQICNHPAQFLGDGSPLAGRSGKLTRLEEMVAEMLAEGDRALIFTQFAEMGDLLRQRLQEITGREVFFLSGKTSRMQRDRMVERFQQEEQGPPIFILSLKAGGVGINLTRASRVFHFDRWWNPAVEQQATDRAFRIGQTQRVQVHTLICAGTLEERIADVIASKREIATNIVGSGEGWLATLSTAQIKDLFALRSEATEVYDAATQ